MRATQRVGDGADLLGHRRIEADARRLVRRRTGRLQAPMLVALACQVAERDLARELARHREQLWAHAATRAETHDLRRPAVAVREAGAELEDVADVGATEPVDRLVRITYGDQQPTVACQVLQQSFLRRIGVLVLVDVDRVEASTKLLCRPLQQPPGLGHEPGVVELVTRLENGEVFVKELARGPASRERGVFRQGPRPRPATRAGRASRRAGPATPRRGRAPGPGRAGRPP